MHAKKYYNERLFGKGFRKNLHLMRFKWLKSRIAKYVKTNFKKNILELGCYDGKTLEFLPWKPNKYVCLDANWEGGLDFAREKYKNTNYVQFIQSNCPKDLLKLDKEFDIFISMETFEHLPTKLLEEYLLNIKSKLLKNALLFITVPNEIGIVFAVKYIAKNILLRNELSERYTLREFLYETLGLTAKVQRIEGGHKGFNYRQFINLLSKYYKILKVEGIPLTPVPYLSFQIGIIAQVE